MAEPMYRQIAEDLRRRIEAGELKRGSQLPTEIDLRELYDTSRNTVRDAIKWLSIRGLVETRPGQGTFVTQRITPSVTTLTGPPEGGDEDVYLAEVMASSRIPELSAPESRCSAPVGASPTPCTSRRAPTSSAGTSGDSSTGPPGPCRRRSTS